MTMYGIIKSLIKIIMRRYSLVGIENISDNGGAIFVCNHAGSYGPLAMGLFFPFRFRPWVLYRAMTPGLCRRQLEKDLFGDCRNIFKPFCRFAAFIIEPACLWVMRKIKAIPVYRGRNEIFATFHESVKALEEGFNIVVFPEREETEYNKHLKDFYTGFVHLARKFYNEKGKLLPFYPIYIDKDNRSITVGKPVEYDPNGVFKSERDRLAYLLMEAIRQCADRRRPYILRRELD